MARQYTETVFGCNTVSAIPENLFAAYGASMSYLKRLGGLRKERGLTQGQLAERMGVEQPTIQRWEKGAREPSFDQLFKLALALGVEPASLIDDSIAVSIGPRLYVRGEVAAGVWSKAVELPESEWKSFTGRADIIADNDSRFGLRVVGDSMDLLYPPGTIVECVSVFGHTEIAPGKRVIVIRTNEAGECEATVKELVELDGKMWAVPRSSNPSHQAICLSDGEPGIIETRVAAVVVASVRPE